MGEVVNAVAEQAPQGTVLVTDVGQNQLFATRYFKYPQKRSICTSGGLGTMGYGMPAAIGATFATDRTVVCFMGDGGFQMNIQELGTIMEQKSPVKMILLNNNYLGNVRQWQDMFWRDRPTVSCCCHRQDADYRRSVHPGVRYYGGRQCAADDATGNEC